MLPYLLLNISRILLLLMCTYLLLHKICQFLAILWQICVQASFGSDLIQLLAIKKSMCHVITALYSHNIVLESPNLNCLIYYILPPPSLHQNQTIFKFNEKIKLNDWCLSFWKQNHFYCFLSFFLLICLRKLSWNIGMIIPISFGNVLKFEFPTNPKHIMVNSGSWNIYT